MRGPQRSPMGREVHPPTTFTPMDPAPPCSVPETVKPAPTNPEPTSSQTFANPTETSSDAKYIHHLINPVRSPPSPHAPPTTPAVPIHLGSSPPGRSQKRKPIIRRYDTHCEIEEPQRKVHLTEDYVAQTMSELFQILNQKLPVEF